jgi:chemotaxis regulatin CheY-phosphate phosphatase CheZ
MDLDTPRSPEDESQEEVLDRLGEVSGGLRELVRVLMSGYGEIRTVIGTLRRSRALMEQEAVERLASTQARLAEVSSTTEIAATSMLDGLDRALALIDEMEALPDSGSDGVEPARLRSDLRDELHGLMNLLQFQDITTQQLGYANSVLLDVEDRMMRLAVLFDSYGVDVDGDVMEAGPALDRPTHPVSSVCDPAASLFDADGRQALADDIFR